MIKIKLDRFIVYRNAGKVVRIKCWSHIYFKDLKKETISLIVSLEIDKNGDIVVKQEGTSPLLSLILAFNRHPPFNSRELNVETIKKISGVEVDAATILNIRNEIKDLTEYLQPLVDI